MKKISAQCYDTGIYVAMEMNPSNQVPLFLHKDGSLTHKIEDARQTMIEREIEEIVTKDNQVSECGRFSRHLIPASVMVSDSRWIATTVMIPGRAEGMSFWWFTFGCGHPLANFVQGIFAKDETGARETAIEFYGRYWSSCYRSSVPKTEMDMDIVDLGGYKYTPLKKFLVQGDVYE